ncbi:MAG: xanthine dehydrogenase family protein molybdopterin-binding subunit [Planctomycetota bacterium]|jgi:isoquinoline 1-oxidoreductase
MKKDKYLESDFKDILDNTFVSRREFLKGLGGGIIILFTVGELTKLEAQRRGSQYPDDFNAYLRISEDGRIGCFSGKVEMGQGAITSLAQELADELDVSIDSVDMVMGDTDICVWDMGTWGSMTTRFFGPALRRAAAEARAVLIELASENLKVQKNQLATKNGFVYVISDESKRVSYGQLAQGKTIARRAKAEPKKPKEFKVMGKSHLRIDSHEKVIGKAKYSGDIRLSGMLYAKILRPPAHRASIKSVNTSAAEKMDGVEVIKHEDMIVVLHKYPDVAEKALKAIKVEFDKPDEDVDDKSIFEHLLKVGTEKEIVEEGGNLQTGEKNASTIFEETYLDGYVAHAPIETHTAVAQMEGDKITVWASTQNPFGLKEEVAEELDLSEENIRIITPFVGGGFGGKAQNYQAIEVAILAKLTGKPVQVAYSRQEEFFYDTFRPAAVVKIKSGITDKGKISLWDFNVYFAGERGSYHIYDIPHNQTATTWGEDAHPFGTGAWRAPANNTNTFARESQIDIMAAKAGIDPLEFRLNNLKDKKMIGVLKTAAEKFGWTPAKGPSGRGYGIACGIDAGTYVAVMAEVEVDNGGNVQVKRVVCAQDMGLVINPQGAIIQMEGCINMGLGYALTEDIRFKGGEILTKNFNTYELPRFSSVPKIETVLVDTGETVPQGGGEPAIIVMGGVIANAIFDATGARVFQMPMTPERIVAAMSKK